MSLTLEDLSWLDAHPEAVEAASGLALTRASTVRDVGELRGSYGEYARALVELVSARRAASAGGKMPADWWVCGDSAQQATPSVVAAERARVIRDALDGGAAGAAAAADAVVADVTCSVGTELPHLAEHVGLVVGGDLDPARLVMAARNMALDPGDTVTAARTHLVRADAVRPVFASGTVDVVVADPARRTARGRIRDPKDLIPPLPDLLSAHGLDPDGSSAPGAPALAVKCAPGIDYSEWQGQVDVVSVDGGVKEACLYSHALATHDRRAVVFRDGARGEVTSSQEESDAVGGVGRYILDPDGAVVRAGLVRQYAARLGWWRLDPHIAYLTGDRLDDEVRAGLVPGQRVFEVLDTVPVKKLRSALAGLSCGRLEVLVRGVDLDPDQLRKKMKLRGAEALTVVVARVGDTPVAVIGREASLRG
ncbi:MAG TPA: hypothetical protein H9870_02755 [Candidatus Corynebacterium avicola]|uniref:THUMP-like domain-containing protein n=1 Tax=Candidatus Corynebacterium avicola TaxID=2838527 RepID=A0A9D1UKC1_9CORY|nr:hypothetical protein [Candidatus Corynebacterium avicola]